jgi:hypothetical protein
MSLTSYTADISMQCRKINKEHRKSYVDILVASDAFTRITYMRHNLELILEFSHKLNLYELECNTHYDHLDSSV